MISVIIPTWNSKDDLKSLLISLSNQTFKDFEVIIVDNNSDDKTEEFVSTFRLGNIKFYTMKSNIPQARNFGVNKSIGEIILQTDSDCIFNFDALEIINKRFDEKVVVTYDEEQYISPKQTDLEKGIFYLNKIAGFPATEKQKLMRLRGNCMIYAKEVHKLIGGFSDDQIASEEPDFGIRAAHKGFKPEFNKTVLYLHKPRLTPQNLFYEFKRNGTGRAMLIKKYGRKVMFPKDFVLISLLPVVGVTLIFSRILSGLIILGFTTPFTTLKIAKAYWYYGENDVINIFVAENIRNVAFMLGLLKGFLK